MKKLRVTIEGRVYEVLVEMLDEPAPASRVPNGAISSAAIPTVASAPIASASAAPAATAVAAPVRAAARAGDVTSPLTGKVVSIDVKVGQQVQEGAQIATIEAMKMNTYIFAPKTGRVDAVLASAGDGVEEGSVLLRIA